MFDSHNPTQINTAMKTREIMAFKHSNQELKNIITFVPARRTLLKAIWRVI